MKDVEYRRSLIARRTLAFLIDHIIFSFVIALFGLLFIGEINNAYGVDLLIYVLPLLLIMILPYFFKDAVNGKSFGKRVLGLQVRSSKDIGDTPSIWKLVLRNITLPIWIIEFFVLIFHKDSKKIGDIIFGTIVIIEKNNKSNIN